MLAETPLVLWPARTVTGVADFTLVAPRHHCVLKPVAPQPDSNSTRYLPGSSGPVRIPAVRGGALSESRSRTSRDWHDLDADSGQRLAGWLGPGHGSRDRAVALKRHVDRRRRPARLDGDRGGLGHPGRACEPLRHQPARVGTAELITYEDLVLARHKAGDLIPTASAGGSEPLFEVSEAAPGHRNGVNARVGHQRGRRPGGGYPAGDRALLDRHHGHVRARPPSCQRWPAPSRCAAGSRRSGRRRRK